MLTRIGNEVLWRIEATSPWTNVYGLARTLLAGAMLVATLRVYAVVPPLELSFAQWLELLTWALIASGWRPRLTGLLHGWLAVRHGLDPSLLGGAASLNAMLALVLVPVTLTDRRRWHWDPPEPTPAGPTEPYRRVVVVFAMAVIRLHVAVTYVRAVVEKLAVEQWAHGTALYEWLHDGLRGAPSWLQPVLHGSTAVAFATWGTMLLEYVLGAALLMRPRYREPLLVAALVHHGLIVVVEGVTPTSLTMVAALILYLQPWSSPLALPRLVNARG